MKTSRLCSNDAQLYIIYAFKGIVRSSIKILKFKSLIHLIAVYIFVVNIEPFGYTLLIMFKFVISQYRKSIRPLFCVIRTVVRTMNKLNLIVF